MVYSLFFWYNDNGDNMNIIDIISKKRLNLELTYDEIKYAVMGFVDNKIPDYQMSSLLMAIVLNGMSDQETFDLTDVMLKSGETIDLKDIQGNVVDKHSTGGVGDKVTLVLAPLLAACGTKIAKMSGRGLGFTGGTIDKLESIPGFETSMDFNQFVSQVNSIGVAVVGQMNNLVPADKKLYALRDVTGTVDSIPLIASSIMSKKIASGADKIVLDVKVGTGALMNTIEQARELSKIMIKIGKKYNKEVVCILTDMNSPLGNCVGNALEVKEAIETLKGNGPKDLTSLVMILASYLISMDKEIAFDEAKLMVIHNLRNGSAYNKFLEFVHAQNGNIEDMKISEKIFSIKSPKTGFVSRIDALTLGNVVKNIGAGRMNKEDKIDYSVGVVLSKKVGDYVLENEELAKVYLNEKDLALNEIVKCFTISESAGAEVPLIKEVIK